jgi:hypothetical protein
MAEAGSCVPLAAIGAAAAEDELMANLAFGSPAAATDVTKPTEATLAATLAIAILPLRACISRA